MLRFKKITTVYLIVIAILIVGFVFYLNIVRQPGKHDSLAQCLRNNGAVFYGAFWCPHCQNQKALFGKSAKLLPYMECSTADGQNQTQFCKDKNIEGYPTWEFSDGSRETGELTLVRLAKKTGCALP